MRYLLQIFICTACFMLFAQKLSAEAVWVWTPELKIQEQYTDNLFLDSDNRESDWITVLGAGMELQGEGKTGGLRLDYSPSYSLYQEYDQYDTLRHEADLELWKDLSRRLRFTVSDFFERREQPQDAGDVDLWEEQEGAMLEDLLERGREPRSINTARARLDYNFGPRDEAYLQYALRNEWNDNPGEEDNERHTPSLGLTYWFSRLYGLQTAGSYTYADYEDSENREYWDGRMRLMRNFSKKLDGYVQYRHSHLRYSGERSGYTVYEPSVGLAYNFAKQGRMSAGLGYYIQDQEDNGQQEGLVMDADISKTWSQRRSSFSLGGSSGYGESFSGTEEQGFTIYYQGRAEYAYALRKDLDWNLLAGYHHYTYKDRDPERRDHLVKLGTGLSYLWTRSISTDLEYEYRDLSSNLEAQEYYENRGTLSLTWRPQGWRWK